MIFDLQQRVIKARGYAILSDSESFGRQYQSLADALEQDDITVSEFDQRLKTLRNLDRLRKISKNRAALANLEELREAASDQIRRLEVSA